MVRGFVRDEAAGPPVRLFDPIAAVRDCRIMLAGVELAAGTICRHRGGAREIRITRPRAVNAPAL